MNIFQRYIDQQEQLDIVLPVVPVTGASIFAVIPCYNEPDIVATLNSLADCLPPVSKILVLVVVNGQENSPDGAVAQNLSTLGAIEKWKLNHPQLFFDLHTIYAGALPQKWAGVGWARKIGMDEAVRQIVINGITDGAIISLDADCTVSPNYLQAIETAFQNDPFPNFFTINFEHQFDNLMPGSTVYEGIIRYELHMRYYRNAMHWCGYPHAIYTVGSSFALRASAYVKQGGMNRRKAGEDFYFLHKLVLLGQYGNIGATTVFPAARSSDRVPFGTGAAIKKWVEGGQELNFTYSLEAFGHLKPLFGQAPRFWHIGPDEITASFDRLHPILRSFCTKAGTIDMISGLRDNCSSPQVFEKRVFHLLNAFWILKYLNFAHESTCKQADLRTESAKLLQLLDIKVDSDISVENLLFIYRNLDKR